jgi:minor extracellular serine protease Vpr
MLKRSLRLTIALACVASLSVTPAFARKDLVGGAANETTTKWFVELSSAPASDGTSKAQLKAERDRFEADAAADGIKLTERYTFDDLLNAVSVSATPADAARIRALPGVKGVYPVHTMTLPPPETGSGSSIDLANAIGMTGADFAHNELGLDGRGVTIAIMDSGVDYRDPELGGCLGPSCKVRGGYDLVGDSYDADAEDTTYQPVPHPDGDPAPCDPNVADQIAAQPGAGESSSGHGTHVAGIAAADGRGHQADGEVVGVAPGARLLAYRVFGCNGGTATDVMIAAMEMARRDHADILNISIGAAFDNWPESPEAQAADRLVAHGMIVTASIGNSGANFGQLWSAGAPGVAKRVIAAASFDNTKLTGPAFAVSPDGKLFPFIRSDSPVTPTSGSAQLVNTSNFGCDAADVPASVAGRIALIRRGSCFFSVKAANAQAKGAAAVVLMNNSPVPLSPTVAGAGITIPVVLVSQASGNDLVARVAAGPTTLTWTNKTAEEPLVTAGLVSDFSSLGTDAELGLKPDIGAPGGQIYSTWPHQQYGGHNTIGGTSMAAPHIAGLAALILQAKPQADPDEVQTLLMNTSAPIGVNVAPGAGLEPTWRQGSGLAMVDRAVLTPASVTPAKLSLGEGNGGSAKLTVANDGRSPVTYDLSGDSTVATGPSGNPAAVFPYTFGYLLGENPAAFSAPSITVPARGQTTFRVTLAPSALLPDKSLYGGYLVLSPRGGGITLRVPYVGFKGDYQSLPVLTSAGCGFPAVFQIRATGSDGCLGPGVNRLGAAGATFTLQGADFPILLYHLNHQVRKLNLQVFKPDGQPVGGRRNFVDQEEYLPRNSQATSFFEFDWDGTRSQNKDGKTRSDRRPVVPDGTYVLKLSVLKALGDEDNPAHWETFTSPPITLARP